MSGMHLFNNGEIMPASPLSASANSRFEVGNLFSRNVALAPDDVDTDAALNSFIVALARNQARIDHLEAIGANDNTKH